MTTRRKKPMPLGTVRSKRQVQRTRTKSNPFRSIR